LVYSPRLDSEPYFEVVSSWPYPINPPSEL